MLILGIIGDWVAGHWFGLWIWLVSLIYEVAAFAFKIFMILANGKLLEEIDYNLLVQNFYTILGVLMLFVVAFALLRLIINPEDQKQGTSVIRKMVINLVTSVIIIAFLPTIFTFAFDVQNSIISYNVIGGFFGFGSLGNQTLTSEPIDVVGANANKLVNSIYTAFFNVDNAWCQKQLSDENQSFDTHLEEIAWCQSQVKGDKKLEISSGLLNFSQYDEEDADKFSTYVEHVSNSGDFGVYTAFSDNVSEGEIKFSVIACIAAGIFTAYIAVSYCFDMALRLIKLVFYQLIAPIPIFLRVIPYGKMSSIFNQWVKITLTCWAEVFVRIMILFFSVFVASKLMATEFLTEDVYNYGLLVGLFANAFVIIGIILFMKKSPKLISEVTGIDSSNMKLGIKDKLAESGVLTAGAVLGAGVTTGIRNIANGFEVDENGVPHKKEGAHIFRSALAGTISGAVRGGKAGWNAKSFKDMKAAASSGAKDAVEAREKRSNYRAAHGGTLGGVVKGHVLDYGRLTQNYVTDQSIEGLTRQSQNMGKIISSYNTFNDTIEQLLEKEQSKGDGSAFLTEGFKFKNNEYEKFDAAAKRLAEAKAKFAKGELSADELRNFEGAYTDARDKARDAIMNMSLQGSEGEAYRALTTKGQALLKDSLVNAETLQATILSNADSKAVQDVMGANGALEKLVRHEPLEVTDFKNSAGDKLRDVAKVYQGEADIKAAVMQKENAAKGDKK